MSSSLIPSFGERLEQFMLHITHAPVVLVEMRKGSSSQMLQRTWCKNRWVLEAMRWRQRQKSVIIGASRYLYDIISVVRDWHVNGSTCTITAI